MDKTLISNQLQTLIDTYSSYKKQSRYNDLSDLPKDDRQGLVTRSIAAIHRITGPFSSYSKEIDRILREKPELHVHTSSIIGIVKALKDDIDSGYIQSLIELIHAEVFSDFLEMAIHLNDSGYKDAAAVIAGSTLENHIKKLAQKNNISMLTTNGKSIKADRLNADLANATIYSKLDQKNITAWLDLRNKAAHGNYTDYNKEQVKLLIIGIQDFITRNPA